MKKTLTIFAATVLMCGSIFSQNKTGLDKLTDNPDKDKSGHYIGKVRGSAPESDQFMGDFEVVFEIWALMGDPVSQFYFKWEYKSFFLWFAYQVPAESRIDYSDIKEKMTKRLEPLPDIKIPLYIQIRKGNTVLAHVEHEALIDLPDPAGKWNTFVLPGSEAWIKAFPPYDRHGGRRYFDGITDYDHKLMRLHSSGNKEEYAKLILQIFKESDNIKVKAGTARNIKWYVGEYKYAIKERLDKEKQQKAAEKAAGKKPTNSDDDFWNTAGTTTTNDDDFWNTTGQSAAEKAASSAEKADRLYDQITDRKDKAKLAEARKLYLQATDNPATAEHAKNQIARIDRVLNYKEVKMSALSDIEMVYVEGNGTIKSFQIGKYEITQKQWKEVMGNNPSYYKGDNLPVERVSWYDVQEFLEKLNEKTGLNYRLPTLAESEYAARGGNKSRGYKYSGSDNVDDVAWYHNNSGARTHQVGTKQPNELGIYDMSGNVWEWCQDLYRSGRSDRQTHSCSWAYTSSHCCHVTCSIFRSPAERSDSGGFRVVLP